MTRKLELTGGSIGSTDNEGKGKDNEGKGKDKGKGKEKATIDDGLTLSECGTCVLPKPKYKARKPVKLLPTEKKKAK